MAAAACWCRTTNYFRLVREVCTKREVLFIGDEVITGLLPHRALVRALGTGTSEPDIMSFAKGVTSGYLPLGGSHVSRDIKDAMDNVKPEDRWMHAYTYSGHPTCCAGGTEEHRDHGARAGSGITRPRWARGSTRGCSRCSRITRTRGDIRGGQGPAGPPSSLVDGSAEQAQLHRRQRRSGRAIQQEMTKRGRHHARAAGGRRAPGDGRHIFYAPPARHQRGDGGPAGVPVTVMP